MKTCIFHIDSPDILKGCGEVYDIEGLFLGEKTYFARLESTSKDGKLINGDLSKKTSIPTSCIEYYAKVKSISVLETYSQLFDGKPIEFDLTNDNNECVFKNNKYHIISSLYEGQKKTTRTCKFVRNEKIKSSLTIILLFVSIHDGRTYKKSL